MSDADGAASEPGLQLVDGHPFAQSAACRSARAAATKARRDVARLQARLRKTSSARAQAHLRGQLRRAKATRGAAVAQQRTACRPAAG